MSDVLSQLEAVIAQIEMRIPHTDEICGEMGCFCDRSARVRSEIARTVERMGECIYRSAPGDRYSKAQEHDSAWAAAFRSTQEQETKK